MSKKEVHDLFIIGGGINGVGIAADAAGRGLSVCLCEQRDLANATSSASSKLIHGGLRYLEHYEFRLVKEALKEREILLKIAPHLIHPLRITLPHNRHCRPRWMVRAGLFLYDHLNKNQILPKSRPVKFNMADDNEPLAPPLKKGYQYSDAATDDARLVVANALSAQQHGAEILTRHRVISAERQADCWLIVVKDRRYQTEKSFHARALINAAGPWVDEINKQRLQTDTKFQVRLVKGSHLVVDKMYDGDHGYILQNSDKRIVFVLPFQQQFTLIGTTDIGYQGDPQTAKISAEEQQYLLDVVSQYFKQHLSDRDVIWTYSGVRPLQSDQHDNPSKVTRDYDFALNDIDGQLPLLSIYGGKLTTYRKLAEHALEKLQPYFPTMKNAWTHHAVLPGGNLQMPFPDFCKKMKSEYAWLPETLLIRWCYHYGTRLAMLLADCHCMADLGKHFGGELYEHEVRFLIETEWAQKVTDILWRRTKQGLFLTDLQVQKLDQWLHEEGFIPETQP